MKLNIQFTLPNPFAGRWYRTIFELNGLLPFWKYYYICLSLSPDEIVDLKFEFSTREDHAGLILNVGILPVSLHITIADRRDWDDRKNCWKKLE